MIETHDLSKSFGSFWAVDGLDLQVGAGRILALLGQNGAGKTTTVRMLSALLSPTRGSALIAGFDVAREAALVRACVGVLTEQHGLYVRMTALEYLDFFGQLHALQDAARARRIDYLLDYFGLEAARGRRIGEYSKGMRQKLALARALIHEPPVLLLDEPTSAMDPESARLVRDEILRLRSSARAIIICTHNLAEAEALADTVAVIYRGRILVQGALEDLKLQVLGPPEYEAQFASPWSGDGIVLPDDVEVSGREGLTWTFRVAHPELSNPQLVRQIVSRNATLKAFQEVPRSLEAVYLRAMERARSREERARNA